MLFGSVLNLFYVVFFLAYNVVGCFVRSLADCFQMIVELVMQRGVEYGFFAVGRTLLVVLFAVCIL